MNLILFALVVGGIAIEIVTAAGISAQPWRSIGLVAGGVPIGLGLGTVAGTWATNFFYKPKHCSDCGSLLLIKLRSMGYNTRTGKTKVETYRQCPNWGKFSNETVNCNNSHLKNAAWKPAALKPSTSSKSAINPFLAFPFGNTTMAHHDPVDLCNACLDYLAGRGVISPDDAENLRQK